MQMRHRRELGRRHRMVRADQRQHRSRQVGLRHREPAGKRRCETAGVRGLQAAIEAWTASGRDLDTAGAVVTGVRPRAPLAPREVRAALGDRLWGLIPTAAAELAAAAEDGILLLDRHDLSAVQAMVTLANRVVPFAAVSA